MCWLIALAGFLAAACSQSASAHEGGGGVWGIEPWILVLMLASLSGYAVGMRNRWRAAHRHSALYADAIAFGAGMLSMALVLGGPVERWTDDSFAAHMVQHEVLMLVSAPLLVLGRPLATWAWAFPPNRRHALRLLAGRPHLDAAWRVVTGVTGATLLQLVAVWGWHVPHLFDLALRVPYVHVLQHSTFLLSSLCFWWATTRRGQMRTLGFKLVALFVTMVVTGALGALLTFAPSVWYATYASAHSPFGLSALEEQQLGGLIMWIPGGMVYLVGAAFMVAKALGKHERRMSAPLRTT
jgi:putative membrane protein